MQGSIRLLTAILLAAFLFPACGRKKQEPVNASSGQTPAVNQPPRGSGARPDDGLRDIVATPVPDAGSRPAAEIPVPADSPVAGVLGNVPADLAESDAVYEAWFRKHKLDLNDRNMLEADADGDGVSNSDEFMADTNPRDPNSLPARAGAAKAGAHEVLKLKKYNEVRLPIVLEAIEGNTARIRRLDQADKIETVRAGQTIDGLGLKVEKVQSRRVTDKHGSGVDASRVTLGDPTTNEKTLLVKDMPARSGASHAVLTTDNGKTNITVRQGETFEWPQGSGTTFKVVDLREDQAVLQEESSGRMWTVSK